MIRIAVAIVIVIVVEFSVTMTKTSYILPLTTTFGEHMQPLNPTTLTADLMISAGTHAGMTGKNNEDAYGFMGWQVGQGQLHLGVVADGVGGQMAGEVASQLAVETIRHYFDALEQVDEHNLLSHLKEGVNRANTAVFKRAQADNEAQGMATTIVVAGVLNGRLYTSHVGDSRIYLRRNGRLSQITQDHSWVQEAITAGLLTPEQAKHHPNRHVIRRSLGSLPETEVDQVPVAKGDVALKQGMPLKAGDVVLLCSDGLTDMVPDGQILATLAAYEGDWDGAVVRLIEQANEAGGRDNITLILLALPEGGEEPTEPVAEEAEKAEEVAVAEPSAAEARGVPTAVPAPPPLAAVPPRRGPLVAHVPLDKEQKARAARRRKQWLTLIVLGFVALLILVSYLQMVG